MTDTETAKALEVLRQMPTYQTIATSFPILVDVFAAVVVEDRLYFELKAADSDDACTSDQYQELFRLFREAQAVKRAAIAAVCKEVNNG